MTASVRMICKQCCRSSCLLHVLHVRWFTTTPKSSYANDLFSTISVATKYRKGFHLPQDRWRNLLTVHSLPYPSLTRCMHLNRLGMVSCHSTGGRQSTADIITVIDSDQDFEQFLAQLCEHLDIQSTSKRTQHVAMENVAQLAKKLVGLECDTRNIVAFLCSNPGLLKIKCEKVLQNIEFLQEIGLSRSRILKALNGTPSLWSASVLHLQSRVTQLRKVGFVEGQLQKLLAEWSEILTISNTKLKVVMHVLMNKCGFSKADVLTILTDSPHILCEDAKDIELKFQYVYFRMGNTNNSEMVRAKLFKYPLQHIRCRHIVLERLGLFGAPDNRGRFVIQNPKLQRIIDCSDRRFAEKCARISIEELLIFARSLEEEIEAERQALEEEDSSEDDEEEVEQDMFEDFDFDRRR